MKRNVIYLAIAVLIAVGFTACKGTKDVGSGKSNEIEVPFSSQEYQSSDEYFRASQSGTSPSLSTAKKIALQNAKSELAGNIQSTIKAVTENYTNQRTVGDQMEFENKFEELSRNVVNQKLTDVRIIGEKTFQNQNNTYTYWVAIEASKDAILNGINSTISQDKKMQLDYDKHLFEKTFNDEMQKFSEGQ
jgi:hypothetical protein